MTIVMETAKALGKWFVLKYVNPISYTGLRRLASVHFRPLHTDVFRIDKTNWAALRT
jgi:hypothetical protein